MPKKAADFQAVDFFCGAGGMTYGFNKAGINVLAGIDIDPTCKETYEKNNKGSKFIQADVKTYEPKLLERELGIKPYNDRMVFIGCSPCQFWSLIRTDKTRSQESKNLIEDFQKFVDYYKPGYVVIENVPGILKKADSPLNGFIDFLENSGYKGNIVKDVIKAWEYGVPQTRKRFLLIATRVAGNQLTLPTPNSKNIATVRKAIAKYKSVDAGHKDTSKLQHTVAGLSDINKERLKKTPLNGGRRTEWSKNNRLQLNTYKVNSHINFQDTYGRMHWDKPGPTITTRFFSLSNGRFGHPEQLRAISLREGAALQTFPDTYQFFGGSIQSIARHIGNAVPPALSEKIAKTILKHGG